MDGPASTRASSVLRALADLSPSTEQRTPGLAIPTEWFRWLPIDAVRILQPDPLPPPLVATGDRVKAFEPADGRGISVDRKFGERLSAVDQIRSLQRSLRVGWLFVAGRIEDSDGRRRRVFHPLVTIPVRVTRPPAFGDARLNRAGDAEVTELVADHAIRHRFDQTIEFGGGGLTGIDSVELPAGLLARLDRLHRFARSLAEAAGLPASRIVPATAGPDELMRGDELVIVAGVGVYAIHQTGESSRASSLRSWSGTTIDRWTAFHSMYLDEEPPSDLARRSTEPPDGSAFLLTPAQWQAVDRSRRDPITLISGAPGTGKSHVVSAIACDALARGERVLVAARTDAAVDALLDLLEHAPGVEPVVFGSNERRETLATRLSAGQLRAASDVEISRARAHVDGTIARRNHVRTAIADQLRAELLLGAPDPQETTARATAAGLFEPDVDLARAETLLESASSPAKGLLSRWRRRRSRRRLSKLARVTGDALPQDLLTALSFARARRAATELQARGGLELGGLWDVLLAADDESRDAYARWLAAESRSPDRLNRSTLSAVSALATALRSGRSARREQLKRLDDDDLTQALPLWVGTLADIDDLLPPVAGLFDLVILDEASSIDQPLAATALLRATRAVIAGDPRQLRQVSFVSDAQMQAVMHALGLDASPVLAARLDVRRNSTFDVAAGVSTVLTLDEHFRSDPHLVDFVARRLYDGQVLVATRSPRTESKDCVEVLRVDGHRDKDEVVIAEIHRAISELKGLLHEGTTSVGVVTPSRAQADAIEAAVLTAFTADQLQALDLRVGTVHAFQGNERDVIIASMGLGSDDGATSWRFVEDPRLFTVFMTRARRRMIILYSADPPMGGLVADYLAQADSPPGRPPPAGRLTPWAKAIADDLVSANVGIAPAYPTGRHIVDICAGDRLRHRAIECGVHPDGPDAHIDRHLALVRGGWKIVEAYESKWSDRRAEFVVNLIGSLQPTDKAST